MLEFIASIVNIIGDNINKLINIIAGKKKEEPKSAHVVKPSDLPKPPSWTRKKK